MIDEVKNNGAKWPKYLVYAIVLFIIHLIILVIIASKQDVALVRKDYYEAELSYQDHITSRKRSIQSEKQLRMLYIEEEKIVKITKQGKITSVAISGVIHFYRASDSSLDRMQEFTITGDEPYIISVDGFKRGLWKVKINWSIEDNNYYTEKTIFVKAQG